MEWESNLCHEKQQIGRRNSTSDGYMQQQNTHDRMHSLHGWVTFKSERLHNTNIMG